MKKVVFKVALIVTTFLFCQNVVYAGSLSISGSSKVTVGSNVVISIKSSNIAGSISVTSSDSSVLSGGTNKGWVDENKTTTYIFKAKKKGTARITLKTIDTSDFSTANSYNTSKSITINVTEPVNYSKNNYLKSLSIEGIKLDFKKDKTTYSVTIPKDTTKIKIDGSTEDSKASISGLGEKTVTEGDNYFEIKVKAENGDIRTYKINALVEESNPINLKLDDIDYRVVKKANQINPPDGYKEEKIAIDGIEVPGFKSDITNFTLVGLKDDEGNVSLAIYNDGSYELYKELKIGNLRLYIVEFPKDLIPKDYNETEITYEDEIIKAYNNEEEKDIYLIYAMNLENGKKNIYQYDEQEKTVQRYIEKKDKGVDEEKIKDLVYKIGIIIVGSILAFIIITVKLALKIKGK